MFTNSFSKHTDALHSTLHERTRGVESRIRLRQHVSYAKNDMAWTKALCVEKNLSPEEGFVYF